MADAFASPNEEAALPAPVRARAAASALCKRFVELDRCQAAAEEGYAVGLFKVLGAQEMAKNDLRVGVPCAGAREAGAWGEHVLGLLHRPPLLLPLPPSVMHEAI